MSFTGLRVEDRLDGETNFGIWKTRTLLLLEEHGLKTYATTTSFVSTDAQQVEAYRKNDAKARCIVMDGVKYHIIPLIAESDTCKKIWYTIIGFYKRSNLNQKMTLKERF